MCSQLRLRIVFVDHPCTDYLLEVQTTCIRLDSLNNPIQNVTSGWNDPRLEDTLRALVSEAVVASPRASII